MKREISMNELQFFLQLFFHVYLLIATNKKNQTIKEKETVLFFFDSYRCSICIIFLKKWTITEQKKSSLIQFKKKTSKKFETS